MTPVTLAAAALALVVSTEVDGIEGPLPDCREPEPPR
jgi:hypothetical protein